jgi:RNA polymerase sigma-70 factor, ECF subfamily
MTEARPDLDPPAQLIELAREGDLDAFDSLVRQHFSRIYALLFRMIGNHEDAEDLTQETFLRAQSSLRWFRGEASFSTWLYRIAVHLSRDHFRKRARSERSLIESKAPEPRTAAEGPAEESARRELSLGLRASLERLPHKLREAIILRTQEGMEYGEIAEVLAISPQTARVQVMKARRRLEQLLEPWTRDGTSGAVE